MFQLDQSRLAVAVSALALASCASAPLKPIETYLGAGWQCFLTPSTFDSPGTIFRIDANRAKWLTAKVANTDDVETGDIAMGRVTVKKSLSIGAVVAAKINDAVRESGVDKAVEVKADGSVSTKKNLIVEFSHPRREVTYDRIKADAAKYFDTNPPEKGSNYFLVREGLITTKLIIQLDTELTQQLGGTATLDGVASVTPSLKRNNDGTYALDQNYSVPIRACIKPERLVIDSVGLNGKNTYRFEPQSEPLEVRKVMN